MRLTEDLAADERWQLIQRIISSAPFQKSLRVRDLLLYVTERSLHGHTLPLSEQHIGEDLFGKPAGYSPLDDSSVRVQVRQLRLKLHEYFDGEGRDESLIVEIPKGSYSPVFRPANVPFAAPEPVQPVPVISLSNRLTWRQAIPWIACAALLVVCICLLVLLMRDRAAVNRTATDPPWPFSQIFDTRHQTNVVVADTNYGMLRILSTRPGSLEEYLHGNFVQNMSAAGATKTDASVLNYLSNSTLTSFADVSVVASLMKVAGPLAAQMAVRFPRDLTMRDLDRDNYVFIGSPASNPWVSLFKDKLDFRETEGIVGRSVKAFANMHPRLNEQKHYDGLRSTGTVGEDYATIALLPNETHDASILILQGLQQEGTEAAGRFLMDGENRRRLRKALNLSADGSPGKVWFEALIRTGAFSGAPGSATLIATRRIQ